MVPPWQFIRLGYSYRWNEDESWQWPRQYWHKVSYAFPIFNDKSDWIIRTERYNKIQYENYLPLNKMVYRYMWIKFKIDFLPSMIQTYSFRCVISIPSPWGKGCSTRTANNMSNTLCIKILKIINITHRHKENFKPVETINLKHWWLKILWIPSVTFHHLPKSNF